jgi:hypothetical protein
MSNYIKWFCEFLGMRYDSKDLLSIWITMKKDISKDRTTYVQYSMKKDQQQLTIFDI